MRGCFRNRTEKHIIFYLFLPYLIFYFMCCMTELSFWSLLSSDCLLGKLMKLPQICNISPLKFTFTLKSSSKQLSDLIFSHFLIYKTQLSTFCHSPRNQTQIGSEPVPIYFHWILCYIMNGLQSEWKLVEGLFFKRSRFNPIPSFHLYFLFCMWMIAIHTYEKLYKHCIQIG